MLLPSVCIILFIAATSGEISPATAPIDLTAGDKRMSENSDLHAKQYADEYIKYMKTGIESSALRELTRDLQQYRSKENWFKGLNKAGDKFLACTTCRAAVIVAARIFREPNGELSGPNREQDARKVLLDLCRRFNIQTQEVCAGFFAVHWPIFDFVIQNATIDARTLCGILPISFCAVKKPENKWSLEINNDGNTTDDKPKAEKPQKGPGDIKILQITDIHYDPEYKAGALAVCDEPLCCQLMPANGDEVAADQLAGYWGDYRFCDAPLHMIENAFDQMAKTHQDIQYIYHTGDVIPHIIWKSTKEGNMELLTRIDKLMAKKFPGIKIFPCVGNHDAHPSDTFSPEDVPEAVNTKWLYEHLYSLWSKHLPPETKATILKGGYYTVSPHAGFRIIALNNIDCYIYNWWLYYNASHAIDQLRWLHDTLLAAEQANEYVHILAHVPTGDHECWSVWSREFNRLIQRFHNIISGIFNGHAHRDELYVHYTPKGHAVGIAWNGGSLTTYVGKNPNYRIYEVEQRTMQVVDYETWIFNLTAANLHGSRKKPKWFKLNHFSNEFTDDLSPAGVDALLEKMAENPELLRKFWRYKMAAGDSKLAEGCDDKCLMDTICTLSRTSFGQKERCRELQAKLKTHLSNEVSSQNSLISKPGHGVLIMTTLSVLFGVSVLIKFLF